MNYSHVLNFDICFCILYKSYSYSFLVIYFRFSYFFFSVFSILLFFEVWPLRKWKRMDILFLLVGRQHWGATLRCCGSRWVHAAVQILGLLLGWFQYLQRKESYKIYRHEAGRSESTYLEWAHERIVYGHHAASVIEFAAVIGRREERDQLATRKELITILNDLKKGIKLIKEITKRSYIVI